jgi:hypothetical protein
VPPPWHTLLSGGVSLFHTAPTPSCASSHHPPPDARFDDPTFARGSCSECRRVQAAAQAAATNASSSHCGPDIVLEFGCDASAPLLQRGGMGSTALPGASSALFVAAAAAGASPATAAAAGGNGATPSTLPACAPVLRWRGGSTAVRHLNEARPARHDVCRSHLASLARRSFGVRMPPSASDEPVRLRGLTPSVALAYGLVPCLGKAVAGEQAAAQRHRLGSDSAPSSRQAADRLQPQQRHVPANNHMLLGRARALSLSQTHEEAQG